MPVKKKKLLLFQLALIAFTLYYIYILYKKRYHLSSVFVEVTLYFDKPRLLLFVKATIFDNVHMLFHHLFDR